MPWCMRRWEAHGPVPRTWAGASPALPSWSPTTRSPTCTLPLDQFRCNVFYEHADGMARARGKVLPWDKKLTLANSKFTACIFIFLIPAPSASNWGSTSLFSPLFLQPALFFSFSAARPSSHPWEWGLVIPSEHPSCNQAKGHPISVFSRLYAMKVPTPRNSVPWRGDTRPMRKTLTNPHFELRQLN